MDTVKFQKQLNSIPKDFLTNKNEVSWQGLSWKRRNEHKYEVFLKNLRLTLNYKQLKIENSLHKFHHGNNYQIFTYKQMKESIEELDSYFDFSIYDFEVIKYTPGIVVEAKPEESYETWIDYKSKGILPMVDFKKGKVYGGCFKAGQIKVKGYNKTYEANKKLDKDEKLTEDLFRFEAEVNAKYVAKNYGLPIQIVSDLEDHAKFSKSLDIMLGFYDKINKDHLDYSKLKCNDYRNTGIFKDKKLSHQYCINHPHTYKKERSKFNALIKDSRYQKKDILREDMLDTIQTMKSY